MYSQQDLDMVSRQLRKRVLVWLLPKTLLFAGVVVSFIVRLEWLTSLLFAIFGAVLLFSLSLYILPVRNYRQHIRNALYGKNTVNVSRFESFSTVPIVKDGVRFYPLMMRVDGPKEEFNQRQFYWDANLPAPSFQPGQKIRITSHDRAVIAWEEAPLDAPTNA